MGTECCGTVAAPPYTMLPIWVTPGNHFTAFLIITKFKTKIFFRSYISFDILRRVLSDYFGFNVQYVMNITDIDDKIIKRARQNYLFEEYVSSNKNTEQVLGDTKDVLKSFSEIAKTTTDPDKKTMIDNMISKMSNAMDLVENAVKEKDNDKIKQALEILLRESKDPLSDWLDKKEGYKVSEHSIFSSLSRHWEAEFHKDMDALNVLPPDVLTRVSEYVPEIIEYIQKIIDNGLAYESNGSVYFDVSSFDSKNNHFYAKLVPEAYGDCKSLQDGEGKKNLLFVKQKLISNCFQVTYAYLKIVSMKKDPQTILPCGSVPNRVNLGGILRGEKEDQDGI